MNLLEEIGNGECLQCHCLIPAEQVYCDECFERLEAEGFFEVPEPFEDEDFLS